MATERCIRILAAQMDTHVGAIERNERAIRAAMDDAAARGADVLVTPELSLIGYPPEDLLLRADFLDRQDAALARLAAASGPCRVLVGFAERAAPERFVDAAPRSLHNAVAVLGDGRILHIERKRLLPDYGVFDETRWFAPAPESGEVVLEISGVLVGIVVCEDLWTPERAHAKKSAGAEILLSVNASPWSLERRLDRVAMARAAEMPVLYLNQVGAQDSVIFDGSSFLHVDGGIAVQAPSFAEQHFLVEFAPETPPPVVAIERKPLEEEVWRALQLGLRDYLEKNGFSRVFVGLSGGIDSAVVAALAADTIGAANVTAVLMPSWYSSEGSVSDALEEVDRLGIDHLAIPISAPLSAVLDELSMAEGKDVWAVHDVAEENIQARVRGIYLMALANKHGGIVLTTANKSEASVGYSTLYGDLAGGLAPIGDVPKTLVYRLARWRNTLADAPIPVAVLEKAPSAELAPDQKDADSLPPYDLLDAVLALYVDADADPRRIAEEIAGRFALSAEEADALVRRVVGLVDRAEYKRRQAPPVLRISTKAFGRDRRLPISNGYRV